MVPSEALNNFFTPKQQASKGELEPLEYFIPVEQQTALTRGAHLLAKPLKPWGLLRVVGPLNNTLQAAVIGMPELAATNGLASFSRFLNACSCLPGLEGPWHLILNPERYLSLVAACRVQVLSWRRRDKFKAVAKTMQSARTWATGTDLVFISVTRLYFLDAEPFESLTHKAKLRRQWSRAQHKKWHGAKV